MLAKDVLQGKMGLNKESARYWRASDCKDGSSLFRLPGLDDVDNR